MRPRKACTALQLYSSGAEAVESALRLAKSHTGKYEFVSFWGGFHGKTMGALSLMGSSVKDGLGPMVPGDAPDPVRRLLPLPARAHAPVVRRRLRRGRAKAAQGGVDRCASRRSSSSRCRARRATSSRPTTSCRAVRQLADEHDALLIADEMITGFGRTGRYWGIEHSGVRPDIVTIGKAFGGGFPLSGVLTTDAIASAKPWSNPSGSSSSYGGNPLGAAAGAAALRAIDDEGLVENARRVGAAHARELQPFVDDYPFVGHVRGRGLFLGARAGARQERRRSRCRAPRPSGIFHECVRRGLLTMAYAPSFRLQPALTIDEATARNGVAVLREVFDLVKRTERWRAP